MYIPTQVFIIIDKRIFTGVGSSSYHYPVVNCWIVNWKFIHIY